MKNGVVIVGRRLGLLATIACGMMMVGCATGEVDRLETANRSLTERNTTLQHDLEEAQSESELLRNQRRESDQTIARQNETINALRGQLGQANERFDEFSNRLSDIQFAELDPQTDQALRDIAQRFPGTVAYDADRGMLRFASDLTFDSGSDVVKADAEASLKALAGVLQSTSAAPYEIQVVGHTDAQPISSATAQRHPSNMHLACHRAIAVRRFLVTSGVDPAKIMAAGWGEYRPVVANSGSGNTPQNRRVEIYLTKSSRQFASTSTPMPSQTAVEPDPQEDLLDPTK